MSLRDLQRQALIDAGIRNRSGYIRKAPKGAQEQRDIVYQFLKAYRRRSGHSLEEIAAETKVDLTSVDFAECREMIRKQTQTFEELRNGNLRYRHAFGVFDREDLVRLLRGPEFPAAGLRLSDIREAYLGAQQHLEEMHASGEVIAVYDGHGNVEPVYWPRTDPKYVRLSFRVKPRPSSTKVAVEGADPREEIQPGDAVRMTNLTETEMIGFRVHHDVGRKEWVAFFFPGMAHAPTKKNMQQIKESGGFQCPMTADGFDLSRPFPGGTTRKAVQAVVDEMGEDDTLPARHCERLGATVDVRRLWDDVGEDISWPSSTGLLNLELASAGILSQDAVRDSESATRRALGRGRRKRGRR